MDIIYELKDPKLEDSEIVSHVVNTILDQVCLNINEHCLENNIDKDVAIKIEAKMELIDVPIKKIEAKMELEEEASSSSSSSSDEDEDLKNQMLKLIEDSEDEHVNPQEKFLTKNEKKCKILYEDETKEDREKRYGFSSENKASEPKKKIGVIQSFFENTVVIKPLIKEVLDLDNLVFVQDEILGKIDDVFGNVDNPFYSILAEPYIKKKLQEKSIKLQDDVFVFETKVKVLLQSSINEIKKKIGCDASNMFDEEINEKELEYSDDEKETKLKNKKKKKTHEEVVHKPFQSQKEKKFNEKQKFFMNRNDHSNQMNQMYGRNVTDFNFWGNNQENYGYYERNEQMNLNQQGPYGNFYGAGPNNNFYRQNQVYNPEYYPNDNNMAYTQQNFMGNNNNYNPQYNPQNSQGSRGFFNKKY